MGSLDWRREAVIGAAGIGFGLLILPFVIHLIGGLLAEDAFIGNGAMELAEQIWLDAVALHPWTWLLIASPYLLVTLARITLRAWRA